MAKQNNLMCLLITAILMSLLTSIGSEGTAQAQVHPSTLYYRDGSVQDVDLRPVAGDHAQGPASVPPDDALDPVALQNPDWWATVQEDIRQSEYHVTWQDQTYLPDLPAAYQAPNRAHNLRTYFTPTGIRIIPRTATTPTWELGLTLTGYGYAGDVQPVAATEPAASANRAEYKRGDLSEWYINDERGLEQGFTIQSPPLPRTSAPLLLELALNGDLTPNLTQDPSASSEQSQAIEFTPPGGVRVLRYSDLHAYDASGRQLPAHFSLSLSHISIWVDNITAVYPITVDLLATSPSHWTARSDQADAYFGGSVGTAGDVNGDGYADVIVGALTYDNGEVGEGRVFVWYGGPDGLGTDDGTPSNADWNAESNQASAHFGCSVGMAGDVNGDGYDDIIVGANQYSSGSSQGRVFVWYGASDGLGANGTPTNADWWAESGSSSRFASSVGTAGDVNGDGYDDIIVGAPNYENGQSWEGGAFVWYGSGNGSASGLGAKNRPHDWQAESNQEQPGGDSPDFGCSVGTLGDVDGDGYDDIIVGASRYISDTERRGGAFVWYGAGGGLGPNGTPGNADWWAESDRTSDGFGLSVGTAGDVNGDSYADAIVGAWLYNHGQSGEGAAFVYHGSAMGLGATANWTAESDQEGAHFGFSVGTAGDMDGDGHDDIIVGAPGYQSIGSVYFWYGSASGLGPNQPDFFYFNPSLWGSNYGESVGTAGDVNGDGFDDFIVGAPLASGPQPNGGHVYAHYGETRNAWTFLLYLDGDNNLHPDIQDVLSRLQPATDNLDLTVLALIDGAGNGDTWRYHVQSDGVYSDGINRWSMGELDMSNPQTLKDFIVWGRENYPAKSYYLAVANHGRGTSGIAWDDTTGAGYAITVAELRTALMQATSDGDDPLDVVHYDACLMAMLEDAYQIKDYADYLIASENLGWAIFIYERYAGHVTASTTPEELAMAVVDDYYNELTDWYEFYPLTISALDLGHVGTVEDAVSALAAALRASLDVNKFHVQSSRDATQKFDSRDFYVIDNDDEYLDLYDFARLIKQYVPDSDVQNAAQGVMDAVDSLVVAERHETGYYWKDLWHWYYWDLDDAHGVSIYFPPRSDGWDYASYMSHVFSFTADGEWDEFLQDYFGLMGLPPETPVDPGLPPMLHRTHSVYLPIVIKM